MKTYEAYGALAMCVGAIAILMPVACGGTSGSNGFGDVDGGGGGGGGGGGSGGGGSGGGSGGGTGSGSGGTLINGDGGGEDAGNGCSGAATNFVYVLSAQNDLYSFAPNLKQFTKIGPLGCQTSLQPNSMAVDRNANAYVNYIGPAGLQGVIYQVSTKDASCSPQPVVTMPAGWGQVGMGYSTIGTSTSEVLYVDATAGAGLGICDTTGGTVAPIGPFTGTLAGQAAELTGTGDGRLFGFFTTKPYPDVAQITQATGATATPVPMTGVPTPTDWAFSFWGGHFYLYVSQGMGTTVVDYDPTTGTINPSYMPNIGFDIVGAGVSTCAPVVPPPSQ